MRYIAIATITSVTVFAFAVWLPNLKLVANITFNSSVSAIEKARFLFSLFGSIQTNFSTVSASYTIVIAVLFGINIALLAYYIRSRKTSTPRSGATLSIGGLVSGMFGIGCASCGTFILSSLLGTVGVLSFLPFGGEEFGFLGVVLMIGSVYWVVKNIKQPIVCVEDSRD